MNDLLGSIMNCDDARNYIEIKCWNTPMDYTLFVKRDDRLKIHD